MIFREALVTDIPQIQIVRHAVKENRLSNPALVTDADCKAYMTRRGKGWVCTVNEIVVGFSIVDLVENNVWALFVTPAYEGKGIGRTLHDKMVDWYFEQTRETLWLGTAPETRAAAFYKAAGWIQNGLVHKNELKFDMPFERWKSLSERRIHNRLGG